jgi:hypothetical protein
MDGPSSIRRDRGDKDAFISAKRTQMGEISNSTRFASRQRDVAVIHLSPQSNNAAFVKSTGVLHVKQNQRLSEQPVDRAFFDGAKVNTPTNGKLADPAAVKENAMSRTAQAFRQTDVSKAIRAARKAEMDVERIEIDRTGRIVIFPRQTAPAAAPGGPAS